MAENFNVELTFGTYTCGIGFDPTDIASARRTIKVNWQSSGGGGIGGSGTLSAPQLGFPTPQQAYTSPAAVTLQITNIGADWISGDFFKLYKSTSPTMSSPVLVGSHQITDTDVANHSFTIGIGSLSAITYFCAIGNDGTNDSQYLSNITAWGSVTAPVITTSASQSVYEQVVLWIPLLAGATVPGLLLSGTNPSGWNIVGGTDQLQYQDAVVSGIAGLQWYNNGVQVYNSPANLPPNNANPYYVTVQATDYFGNVSSPVTIGTTVNQIVVGAITFANVANAAFSTVYNAGPDYPSTSTGQPLSITPTGTAIAASLSGSGFYYSKNGGAWTSAGSFTVQSGDKIDLQGTSGNANSITNTAVLTIASQVINWSIATPGSAATNTIGNGTTGAGPNKSKYLNATAFAFIHLSNIGVACMDRSDLSQANVGWYAEFTIQGWATSGVLIFGVDDGTTDWNAGGTGYVNNNPGKTTLPGFCVTVGPGATSATLCYNGGTHNGTLPGGNVATVGDTIGIYYNSSTNAANVYWYSAANGDLGSIGSFTLTSLIPSTVYIVQGGQKGNGVQATSDSGMTNYGGSAYVRTKPTGSTYFA